MPDQNVAMWVSLISVLVGGGLTGGFALLSNFLNKRSEEKQHEKELKSKEEQHKKELLFTTAIENWKQVLEVRKLQAKDSKENIEIYPVDSYIMRMVLLFAALEKVDYSSPTQDIVNELNEFQSTMSITDLTIFKDYKSPLY